MSERQTENGISNVVLYFGNEEGIPWSGVISLETKSEEGVSSELYLDGLSKERIIRTSGYSSTITAYHYPDRLDRSDDFQCSVSYRTEVEDGYLLHLIYNANLYFDSMSGYEQDINGGSPSTFKWVLNGLSRSNLGFEKFSYLIIDSRTTKEEVLGPIEAILYGIENLPSQLPSPDQILEFFEDAATLRITDHGDGSYTAEGPDHVVYMTGETEFEISWPSVIVFNQNEFEVSSL